MLGDYNPSIYYALEKAQIEKGLRKLRFVLCAKCGRYTPYRLKNVRMNFVRCKECGDLIHITKVVTTT